MKKVTPPILDWIPLLILCLHSASGSIRSFTIGEVKNLQTLITIELSEPYSEKDEPHVRNIIKAFSEANECRAKSIGFDNERIIVQMLLKYPYGPSKHNDPFQQKIHVPAKENRENSKKRTII